ESNKNTIVQTSGVGLISTPSGATLGYGQAKIVRIGDECRVVITAGDPEAIAQNPELLRLLKGAPNARAGLGEQGDDMSKWRTVILAPALCLLLGACATDGTPIVAGAVDQVGVSISGGPQEQGGNLTVGYRGAKFAVVPVENRQGQTLLITDSKGS